MKANSLMSVVLLLLTVGSILPGGSLATQAAEADAIATFSIVARDPATNELGVAVASRFFAVGSVVPWARADVGAVATQAYANTTFGWRALDMLEAGMSVEAIRDSLVASDPGSARRQFGIVAANGEAVTFTGDSCSSWAGGRAGANYAIQGNILAGEQVVAQMEKAFLASQGSLASRLYAALLAGEAVGGDSRGKQSAAIYVVKAGAGYGGFTDNAIDIRVDDSPEPFQEIGRLLNIAEMNYSWNEAWTLFTRKEFKEALPLMERTARLAPDYAEVLYDLAVIRLANDDVRGALTALEGALKLSPKLAESARADHDFDKLRGEKQFESLLDTAGR